MILPLSVLTNKSYHLSFKAGGMIYFVLGIVLFSFSLSAQTSTDFYRLQHIPEAKVYFPMDNWSIVLDSLKQGYGEEEGEDRLLGSIKLDGKLLDSVGVRFKGNSSYFNVRKYNSSKLPFNIKLDYIKTEQSADGFHQTLKLSNVFRDPSFLREVLAYEVAGKYLVAPKANFIKLYVNDTYLGLYNNTESVDKAFLKKYYGDNKGAFFKCDPDWRSKQLKGCPKGDKASLQYLGSDSLCYEGLYEIKSKSGWDKLIELTKVLNEDIHKIEKILDVDATLWMLAFNNAIVNLDSYSGRLCHNYYLYQDSFGIFHPIVWDMNLAFGGFRFDGQSNKSLSNGEMQEMSPFIHYKNPLRPLISQVLQKDLYRKIYLHHLKTIMEENFQNASFSARLSTLKEQLDLPVKEDDNKLYAYEDFLNNQKATTVAGRSKIIGLAELMDGRMEYLENHPLMKKEFPEIQRPSYTSGDDTYTISSSVTGNFKQVYISFRPESFGPFKRKRMYDDGTHGDETAGDGIWTREINQDEVKQYYLIAEAEKVASLLPKRAAKEFFEIK